MLRGFFRRCLAVVLSALIPGSGQIFNRQPGKGLAILISIPTFALLAGGISLFNTFRGLVIGVVIETFLVLWAVVDSAVCGGQRAKERGGFSKSRVLYLSAMVLIVMSGVAAGTNFYRNHLLHGLTSRVDPSNSMAPAIQAGDRFVSDLRYYEHHAPQRGEVVLFQQDAQGHGTEDNVKRIIAIGGDTIEGTKDGIFLNGKFLREPYAKYESPQEAADTKRVFGLTKVAPGEYFVMGDNRYNSYDSRYFGTIPLSRIEGRALYLYWSRDRSRIGQAIR